MNTYVNHGRWVADCPTVGCYEAHQVAPGERFTCSECGYTAMPAFPPEMRLIEAALSRRLLPATRNWYPGETVADLETENRAHAHEGVVA